MISVFTFAAFSFTFSVEFSGVHVKSFSLAGHKFCSSNVEHRMYLVVALNPPIRLHPRRHNLFNYRSIRQSNEFLRSPLCDNLMQLCKRRN